MVPIEIPLPGRIIDRMFERIDDVSDSCDSRGCHGHGVLFNVARFEESLVRSNKNQEV